MTRATLTAKMALTAKMRDCSRFIAWISRLHLLPKWRPTLVHKKSRTQFWLSDSSGIIYHLWRNTVWETCGSNIYCLTVTSRKDFEGWTDGAGRNSVQFLC
jgi:hypothetical protein